MYYLIATANITARMRGYANKMFGGKLIAYGSKMENHFSILHLLFNYSN